MTSQPSGRVLRTRRRLRFLDHPESDGLHGRQSLVAGLGDVRRRQEEAVAPAVLELHREGVLDADVVRPVVGAARSQVWGTEMKLVCV